MKTRRTIIIASALAAVIIGITLTVSQNGNRLMAGGFLDEANAPSPIKNQNKQSHIYETQEAFHKIYREYKDSVVYISTEKTVDTRNMNPLFEDPLFRQFFGDPQQMQPRKQKQKGLGTGFILSSDGYICTNHHVVDKMDTVTVVVDDKEYKAAIIGSDQLTDIALLKIQGNHKFTPVHFGNSDNVQIGDIVMAIGNPFGLDKTLTSGIVSATGRKTIDALGMSHIQTDASINPGNSGGPLINIDGEVIGVNRMIYSQTGGNLGIGFAIPINLVKDTLAQLQKYKKIRRGYIGVQISPLTEEFAKELGIEKPEGALVGSIEKNGPADKGGLQIKDIIITIDDKKIESYKELLDIVSKTPIGKTVKVTVWREKKSSNFWVTVGERPN